MLGRCREALAALRRAYALVNDAANARLAVAICQGEVWSTRCKQATRRPLELLREAVAVVECLGSAADSLRLCTRTRRSCISSMRPAPVSVRLVARCQVRARPRGPADTPMAMAYGLLRFRRLPISRQEPARRAAPLRGRVRLHRASGSDKQRKGPPGQERCLRRGPPSCLRRERRKDRPLSAGETT
jgi:hypothetical protein